MGKDIQLRLLGPFDARDRSGRPLAVTARKNRALIGLLALSPTARMSRGKLASLVWSERTDAQARANLRQLLAELRKNWAAVDVQPILADDEHIWIDLDAADIDVRSFRELSVSDDLLDLRRATELYRGEFLEDTVVEDPAFADWL